MARVDAETGARAAVLAPFGREDSVDRTNGLRVMLHGGRIVHLRQSGNAPEPRWYARAESQASADDLLARGLAARGQALA